MVQFIMPPSCRGRESGRCLLGADQGWWRRFDVASLPAGKDLARAGVRATYFLRSLREALPAPVVHHGSSV